MRASHRATASALALAVLLPLGAGAAGATYEGGLDFAPDTWQTAPDAPGMTVPDNWQVAPDPAEPLPGPPERLEDAAKLGQVDEAAKEAAQQEAAAKAAAKAAEVAKAAAVAQAQAAEVIAEHPEAAERVAPMMANAGMQVAEVAAKAAQLAANPANLGVAEAPAPAVDMLSVTFEEVVGDFPEGQQNTAALAAWKWLQVHGWRGDPRDGQERLYAPDHPNYPNTVRVGELESVWCFPILPGSDVTDHVADVLRNAGWFEADVWGDGVTWLMPPEAA